MDESTLASLEAAFRSSPENEQLLSVLLKAYLEREEPGKGAALLRSRNPVAFADRGMAALAARVLLAAGDAEGALEQASGKEAEALLVRARALLALDRREEGRKCYEEAVSANPTLEDGKLASALAGRVRTFPVESVKGARLRVISNDDTDQSETTRLLAPELEKITFADVGGLEEIKTAIEKRIILPFQKPGLFERFKKRVGGGILLYGPPGCGKTLLARATAGECKAQFLNVAISDILDMFIGESERKLHAIFEKARQCKPSVLFFDELEALGGKRQYHREASSSKLVSQFLSELDGFSRNNDGVLVLGATNVPWDIDPAFRRPGRFDRVLFVPPPDREARERVLTILLGSRPIEGDLDIPFLAKHSSGFSGADLMNLVETGADEAIEASLARGSEVPIRSEHLRAALKQIKPTTAEWLSTARNYARYANEAGHYDEVLDFLSKHGK
jgi:SpoVK/Ycf46/Vps4 family AAA+-type ATPase